jgi:hypothetical protein
MSERQRLIRLPGENSCDIPPHRMLGIQAGFREFSSVFAPLAKRLMHEASI